VREAGPPDVDADTSSSSELWENEVEPEDNEKGDDPVPVPEVDNEVDNEVDGEIDEIEIDDKVSELSEPRQQLLKMLGLANEGVPRRPRRWRVRGAAIKAEVENEKGKVKAKVDDDGVNASDNKAGEDKDEEIAATAAAAKRRL